MEHAEGNLPSALAHALESVRCLEVVRGSLGSEVARSAFHRQWSENYAFALDLAAEGIASGLLGSGEAALEIAESARSGSLAEVLRGGGISVSGEAAELLERIVALEAQLIIEPPFGGERRGPEPSAARTAGIARDLAALRDELAMVVSRSFASAFRPGRPDVGAITDVLRGEDSHALVFNLERDDDGAATGHVVWVQPSGDVTVERVVLDVDLVDFIRRFELNKGDDVHLQAAFRWDALGKALLPQGLRELLINTERVVSLVVVPDGVTQALALSALNVGDGTKVVHHALVRTIPSLTLLSALATSVPQRCVGTLAHFDHTLTTQSEAAAVGTLGGDFAPVTETTTRDEVLDALSSPTLLWAMGTHCDAGDGLAQSIRLDDGGALSAGALLGHATPQLVSLGSCFGARLPLGLATVCLTQGTRTVLGPLLDIDDPSAGVVLAEVYQLLGSHSPAEALRTAQLSYLDANPGASPREWAVLISLGI